MTKVQIKPTKGLITDLIPKKFEKLKFTKILGLFRIKNELEKFKKFRKWIENLLLGYLHLK